jgi:hypothetical protein
VKFCLLLLTKQIYYHWTGFHEIFCWGFLQKKKSVDQIRLTLKSDKITGTSHDHVCTYLRTFMIIPRRLGYKYRRYGRAREDKETAIWP